MNDIDKGTDIHSTKLLSKTSSPPEAVSPKFARVSVENSRLGPIVECGNGGPLGPKNLIHPGFCGAGRLQLKRPDARPFGICRSRVRAERGLARKKRLPRGRAAWLFGPRERSRPAGTWFAPPDQIAKIQPGLLYERASGRVSAGPIGPFLFFISCAVPFAFRRRSRGILN